ncbi:MAG TPA: dihydrolipoamide acetyltransferase family protein [Verrucomicrobiae bacterium]|nr:dihydrolipoamide acetyltransferase family protein [Verrucomicrobiae bacterium]
MAHAILMPKPGQMTEECTVIAWHKKEGDPVRRGDILFEIETDKSTMEVEAFDDGVLLRIVADVGATIPVNTVCAYVGEPGETIPETVTAAATPAAATPAAATPAAPDPSAAAAPVAAPAAASATMTATAAAPGTAAPAPARPDGQDGRLRISPRASRAAAEAGIDPRAIAGSGPGGRITERDVLAAIAAAAATPATTATIPATLATTGAGPAAAAAPAAGGAGAAQAAAPRPMAPVDGEDEPRPLSRMRRVIADRLTQSWTSTPHFTVTVAVDVTRLLALRAELKAAGTNLTVTDFVLAATAQTLAEFPDVNSRTDGISVWTRRRVHLGVAVSLPSGLVVPVIRDADRLPIGDLHERTVALATAAREGTLPVDDMTGSTFTVSNLGMFGVDEFSAIINPGEAAILAVSSAIPTAVVIEGGLAVRSVMKLTLSADHRMVDGELGARFLGAIRRRLEDAGAFRQEALNA